MFTLVSHGLVGLMVFYEVVLAKLFAVLFLLVGLAFVPGVRSVAKKRSATSRCTITHHVRIEGARPRDSTTRGVATL